MVVTQGVNEEERVAGKRGKKPWGESLFFSTHTTFPEHCSERCVLYTWERGNVLFLFFLKTLPTFAGRVKSYGLLE